MLSNEAKRAAHQRRVQAALTDIFNDPTVMPNADCEDLVVSVRRVEFGKTVRDISIDVSGDWRGAVEDPFASYHEKYMRAARDRGEETYVDLTDVTRSARLMEVVARELSRRLGLRYVPDLRLSADGREGDLDST